MCHLNTKVSSRTRRDSQREEGTYLHSHSGQTPELDFVTRPERRPLILSAASMCLSYESNRKHTVVQGNPGSESGVSQLDKSQLDPAGQWLRG